MDSDFEKIKQAISDAGFTIMSDEELSKWLQKSKVYHESPEGQINDALTELKLDHYLEKIAKYKFIDSMGEISGFGGSYEKACRVMLDAGLQWFDNNPNANPQFKGSRNIYGIIIEDNKDAKTLSKIVIDASGGDCTGAMHQAVISSILWIHKNSWDAYIKAMSKEKGETP